MVFIKSQENCQSCQCLPLCLPNDMSPSLLAALSTAVNQHRSLNKQEMLVRFGDSLTHLYVLRSGSLKAWQVDAAGHERVLHFYFPGELIGLDALSHKQYILNIQALEPCAFCEISYDKLNHILCQWPTLQTHLLMLASQKLSLHCQLLNSDVSIRLMEFLRHLQSRISHQPNNEIKLPMSRADIGNYLNVTPETISRLLTRLEHKGLLCAKGKKVKFM